MGNYFYNKKVMQALNESSTEEQSEIQMDEVNESVDGFLDTNFRSCVNAVAQMMAVVDHKEFKNINIAYNDKRYALLFDISVEDSLRNEGEKVSYCKMAVLEINETDPEKSGVIGRIHFDEEVILEFDVRETTPKWRDISSTHNYPDNSLLEVVTLVDDPQKVARMFSAVVHQEA